jgi:alkanesulfonate monooxygenase SsuD/methylene tetrahydromethanopterin reductase-like flavin-dependent oxidoreductase (luciferase family)
MRALWQPATPEQAISYSGQFYQLNNAQPGPAPAHPISIWIGANRPRMLQLIGRMADGWIVSASYVPPENIPDLQAIIDDAAQGAGRDTTAIRRAYNLAGTILRPGAPAMAARRRGIIAGPASQWTDELMRYYSDLRMDTFILWPIGDEEAQIRTFAEEVVPALKERINSH